MLAVVMMVGCDSCPYTDTYTTPLFAHRARNSPVVMKGENSSSVSQRAISLVEEHNCMLFLPPGLQQPVRTARSD